MNNKHVQISQAFAGETGTKYKELVLSFVFVFLVVDSFLSLSEIGDEIG